MRRVASVLVLPLLLLSFVAVGTGIAGVAYVHKNAPEGGDGTGWGTAFRSVQAGIDAVKNATDNVREVRVAGDNTIVYFENIHLDNGVALYGGYSPDNGFIRNPDVFETILDGSALGSVVTIADCDSPLTRIDGFTIRNGTGTFDNVWGGTCGGGIYCVNSSAVIANNRIAGNGANRGAGVFLGIHDEYPYRYPTMYPVLDNNEILGNAAAYAGGGVYLADMFSPVHNFPLVTRNTIRGNTAAVWGGGIYDAGSQSDINNNEIAFNNAFGIFLDRGNGTLANNTVAYNGGAVFFFNYSAPSVRNNLLVDTVEGCIYIHTVSGSRPTFGYNGLFGCVKASGSPAGYVGFPDEGDIYAPLTANPGFADNVAGDFHLVPGSPCIDNGYNASVSLDDAGEPLPDRDGSERIRRGSVAKPVPTVDLGAYETPGDTTPPSTYVNLTGTLGSNGWFVSAVQATLTANDSGSGVEVTYYNLDNTGMQPYTGPVTLQPAAPNATHTLLYHSVDRFGNAEAPKTAVVRIDASAPVLASSDPANNATGVRLSKKVVLTFDDPVQAGASYAGITFKKGNNSVAFTKSITGNTLTLSPSANLSKNSTYTIVVPVNALKNLAGISQAAAYTVRFTTGTLP